jgi:hypothetical protein
MNEITAIVTGPEEAYNNEAELWCARSLRSSPAEPAVTDHRTAWS